MNLEMSIKNFIAILAIILIVLSCSKKSSNGNSPPAMPNFYSTEVKLNGQTVSASNYDINFAPVIKFSFSAAVNKGTVPAAFIFQDKSGAPIGYSASYENSDKTVIIQPSSALNYLTKYSISVSGSLKSAEGGTLVSAVNVGFTTKIDSSRKFILISDDALLTLIQQQTFKYFWDFGHPVSG